MVVRVFDTSDECDVDCDVCYSCSTTPSNSSESSTNGYTTSNTTTASNNDCENFSETKQVFPPINFSISCKNLVGNFKEFRIENNKNDLRIIGNGNRIRISNNIGNLNIIGNSTRLKITHNSGPIKYTGNDGRIYLGSDSTQQTVDYTGCNGILKIINLLELNGSSKNDHKDKSSAGDAKNMPANPTKAQSSTYGGSDDCKSAHWQHFADVFHRRSAKTLNCSLPNSVLRRCECGCKCKTKTVKSNSNIKNCTSDNKHCKVNNNISVVQNVANVVINNTVDVRIKKN